jgi:hypothetical protein
MAWSRKLPVSIRLNDGRTIATLGHARALMLELPVGHQVRPYWQFAAELLLDAAEQNGDIDEAWAQFSREACLPRSDSQTLSSSPQP